MEHGNLGGLFENSKIKILNNITCNFPGSSTEGVIYNPFVIQHGLGVVPNKIMMNISSITAYNTFSSEPDKKYAIYKAYTIPIFNMIPFNSSSSSTMVASTDNTYSHSGYWYFYITDINSQTFTLWLDSGGYWDNLETAMIISELIVLNIQ